MLVEAVYLDNNASRQPLPGVVEAISVAMPDGCGNRPRIRGRGANVYLNPCLIKAVKRAAVDRETSAFSMVSTALDAWLTSGAKQAADGADG